MASISVSERLRSNYEDYYDEGDSEWRRRGAVGKAQNIVALCGSLEHDSILEIGAGEGAVLQRLSDLGFGQSLHALDISPSGVETINRKAIQRLVECRTFDGSRVPYDDDRFDLAVLSHVIEHVEHPRQLIYEASRVARHVFVEVPLEDTIRLPRDFVFDTVGHINVYSPTTIRHLLQSCGLRVIRQINANPAKGTFTYHDGNRGLVKYHVKGALLRLAPRLATEIFSYHSALVCERSTT